MKITLLIITSLLLFAGILNIGFAHGADLPTLARTYASQAPLVDQFLYLPVTFGTEGLFLHNLGSEIYLLSNDTVLDMTQGAKMRWVRYNAFRWDQIEPTPLDPPDYNWDAVNNNALQKAAERGLNVIAIIRYTPAWARKFPEYSCGPVAEQHLDAFAQFVGEVVTLYSGPPFYIKHYEFGNEQDIDPYQNGLIPYQDYVYGCWGDNSDDYYGGEYYAQMLEHVYPAVKAADPDSKVLIGGLLLDCDPTNPPSGKDCKPAKFLEGILRYNNNQGANYFDLLSFHGYAAYYRGVQHTQGILMDENFPSWDHRGGIVIGKVDYIREVMSAYNVDKPLFHTEGALICPSSWVGNVGCNPPEPEFFEAQADYVVWLYVRNMTMNMFGTVWYTLDDVNWRSSSLLNPDLTPRPSYYSYQFMSQELEGAIYLQPVNEYVQYPAIRAFNFWKQSKNIWVIWAADRTDYIITLPINADKVYDKYGNEIIPSGGQITVNSPVYVEISP